VVKAESDQEREKTVRFVRESMSNRLDDEASAIVIITQHLHEDGRRCSWPVFAHLPGAAARWAFDHDLFRNRWAGRVIEGWYFSSASSLRARDGLGFIVHHRDHIWYGIAEKNLAATALVFPATRD
jgi:hypothetical protein